MFSFLSERVFQIHIINTKLIGIFRVGALLGVLHPHAGGGAIKLSFYISSSQRHSQ